MRLARPTSRSAVVGVAALAGLAAAGGITVALTRGSGTHDATIGSRQHAVPAAHLSIAHLHHGMVPVDQHVRIHVANGALSTVTVKNAQGQAMAGHLNARHTVWRSEHAPGPQQHLTGAISYADLAHHTISKPLAVRTPAAKHTVDAVLSPGDGGTVGVGSPVVVSFSAAIPSDERAAVERRLSVTTAPSVVGAWHWMSDQEVHWRPPAYWKTGTVVHLASDLTGLHLGKDTWGAVGRHSTSFSVGASHVSIADVATDQMQVFDNGKLLRTLPFSAGRAQYPTKNGVHIALEKSSQVVMDSATVGIPKGTPGYYYETVYWDVRISDGGAFVHAAPWSVADQGHSNVSHGCINLSTSNAEWFYNWARNGDVVDVINSAAPVNPADPGMADWNMSWKQWVAGDAAPTAAAKQLHPLLPMQGEPGMAPVTHHRHAKAGKKHSKHASTHHH